MKRALAAFLAGLAIAGSLVLAGCNADTKLTKQEEASIKGNGQMPESARQMMAQKQQEAAGKMAQQKQGPGAPATR